MRTGWLDLVIAGVAVACAVSQAVAVTVVVPTDELTIQAAVDAAGPGGMGSSTATTPSTKP
jgi:hypothetical protein